MNPPNLFMIFNKLFFLNLAALTLMVAALISMRLFLLVDIREVFKIFSGKIKKKIPTKILQEFSKEIMSRISD